MAHSPPLSGILLKRFHLFTSILRTSATQQEIRLNLQKLFTKFSSFLLENRKVSQNFLRTTGLINILLDDFETTARNWNNWEFVRNSELLRLLWPELEAPEVHYADNIKRLKFPTSKATHTLTKMFSFKNERTKFCRLKPGRLPLTWRSVVINGIQKLLANNSSRDSQTHFISYAWNFHSSLKHMEDLPIKGVCFCYEELHSWWLRFPSVFLSFDVSSVVSWIRMLGMRLKPPLPRAWCVSLYLVSTQCSDIKYNHLSFPATLPVGVE